MRLALMSVVVSLALAACSGGAASAPTTTVLPSTTTTVVSTTTTPTTTTTVPETTTTTEAAVEEYDPYEEFLVLAGDTLDFELSRDDAMARAWLGCGTEWPPGTIDYFLAQTYRQLEGFCP